MTGRLVSNYKIGEKAPGWHEFTWQGTDTHGQKVGTGMYLVTMRAGEHFQKQKVTFLK
jgi:flagellar hook assembly protein FlgD